MRSIKCFHHWAIVTIKDTFLKLGNLRIPLDGHGSTEELLESRSIINSLNSGLKKASFYSSSQSCQSGVIAHLICLAYALLPLGTAC